MPCFLPRFMDSLGYGFFKPLLLKHFIDFCLGYTSARNSGNCLPSLPHTSSPSRPLVNTHPSPADQLHIRVCRRRPRWLCTNGSSVICTKSQCLSEQVFFCFFFEAKHSIESNVFCSLSLLSLFLCFWSNTSLKRKNLFSEYSKCKLFRFFLPVTHFEHHSANRLL